MSPRKKPDAPSGAHLGPPGYRLSDEFVGGLTLADLERIAERFGAAVRTIREAQLLFRGGGELQHPAHEPGGHSEQQQGRAGAPTLAHLLTPEQQAEMDKWRQSPARQALLDQLRGSEPKNGVPE